ncbi:ubiquinol-cytochrome C chaperone family protein [Sphingomonas morindae]|uniref:Ubiquinol-cytochrome C chaperone n=1 Tax=Sphingomonas morindae TaxID=1541170 RepID=A0ABY4X9K7_9SPHN|nr:ubiquinol-cytochrome C chaperone family protein [Sphingomonas morindae]USI73370.1 ubiquinol-cytochrome C chaperone [Sphingomonas morindae]
MTFWKRLFGGGDALVAPLRPLYAALVAAARQPDWYRTGAVPDTADGRFDMLSSLVALALLRLEAAGAPGREPAARLAELFIADMDAQLRERGVGDLMVGKHVGRMMSQLGGRMEAFRAGLGDGDLAGAVARNIHRGAAVPPEASLWVAARLQAIMAGLDRQTLAGLLAGRLE